MRLLTTLIALLLIVSCDFKSTDSSPNNSTSTSLVASINPSETKDPEPKYHYVYYKDKETGEPILRFLLPVGWEADGVDGDLKGPNGISVKTVISNSYTYNIDPYQAYAMQQDPNMHRQFVTMEDIFEQEIKPYYQRKGYTFIGHYPLESVYKKMQNFEALFPQSRYSHMPIYYAVGSDWKDDKGNSIMVVLTQMFKSFPPVVYMWSYGTIELKSTSKDFEEAKATYLFAFTNEERSPSYLQKSIAMRYQLVTEHDASMDYIEQAGRQSRAAAQASSAMLDQSFESYKRRSAMSDASHSQYIDMIHERTNIQNPNTGQIHQGPTGGSYYWVNNQGQAINTNNSLFDPNIEQGYKDNEWVKFNVVD